MPTIIAKILKDRRLLDTNREDVERILSEINSRRTRGGQPINAWTKRGYKVAAEVF